MPVTHRTVHTLDERRLVRDWLVTKAFAMDAELSGLLRDDGDPFCVDGALSYTHARWVLTNGPDVSPFKERVLGEAALTAPPTGEVTEGGAVTLAAPGMAFSDTWHRWHCSADGLLDWSEFCYTPQWRYAAAATVLEVDQADRRTLEIASTGPFRAWLDGREIARNDDVRYMEPAPTTVEVWLPSGTSTLVIGTWQVAFREVRHVVRVRVLGLPVRVVVPSEGADEDVARVAEHVLNAVGSPRWGSASRDVLLTGPAGVVVDACLDGRTRRVELGPSPVAVDFNVAETGEDEAELSSGGSGASMLARPYDEVEIALADAPTSPIRRRLPFARLPERYRDTPEGEPAQWRREFFEHALEVGGTASALAARALRPDAAVASEQVEKALWMITHRADCADFEAVGLVHLLHRVPAEAWDAGVRERVLDALLGFKFWIDQPGLDAMCYFTENHQFVWHTAEHLVGSLLPDETFTNSGWSGRHHAEHGRDLALAWLRERLPHGFAEFDSNAYLAIDCLAAVSLVEFSDDDEVRALAAGLADRVLLSLATNTWRGVHGAAHGRSYLQTQRSSRLEETAPISWVCFGVGALNDAVLPTAVIATARRYRVPEIARQLATALDAPTTTHQRYAGQYRLEHDLLWRPYRSHVIVHRTRDGMLSSVQDYRSGLPGLQEYVWGATLGPETQVSVTHAPNSSVSPSARPNAWAGNRELPRVHQHEDALIALYRIGADDPMGFTHAWFPTTHMDEWLQAGSWTAGRRGEGYVALSCEGGARLVTSGEDALQELRPLGPGTAWVCVLGSAGEGSLADFVASLGEPAFGRSALGERVDFAPQGRARLTLDFDGPFLVDGCVAERPGCAPGLDGPHVRGDEAQITWSDGDASHTLDLVRGRPS